MLAITLVLLSRVHFLTCFTWSRNVRIETKSHLVNLSFCGKNHRYSKRIPYRFLHLSFRWPDTSNIYFIRCCLIIYQINFRKIWTSSYATRSKICGKHKVITSVVRYNPLERKYYANYYFPISHTTLSFIFTADINLRFQWKYNFIKPKTINTQCLQ